MLSLKCGLCGQKFPKMWRSFSSARFGAAFHTRSRMTISRPFQIELLLVIDVNHVEWGCGSFEKRQKTGRHEEYRPPTYTQARLHLWHGAHAVAILLFHAMLTIRQFPLSVPHLLDVRFLAPMVVWDCWTASQHGQPLGLPRPCHCLRYF